MTGKQPRDAINKLKDAIDSFQYIYEKEPDIYSAPISIEELHEFLTVEEQETKSDIYELRKVYA